LEQNGNRGMKWGILIPPGVMGKSCNARQKKGVKKKEIAKEKTGGSGTEVQRKNWEKTSFVGTRAGDKKLDDGKKKKKKDGTSRG